MRLPSKDPQAWRDITFDFTADIGAAAINGVPVVSIAVETGIDADVGQMFTGAATVQSARVLQRVKLGVDAVDYYLHCVAILNDGQRLTLGAILPVRDAGRRDTNE